MTKKLISAKNRQKNKRPRPKINEAEKFRNLSKMKMINQSIRFKPQIRQKFSILSKTRKNLHLQTKIEPPIKSRAAKSNHHNHNWPHKTMR